MQGRVLVVEADRAAREALVTGLRFIAVDARGARDLEEARRRMAEGGADVVVMSDDFGQETLRDALGDSLVAPPARVLVLARGDGPLPDYPHRSVLRRPIAPRRVIEQVEALLRARGVARPAVLTFHDLTLDTEAGLVARGSARVALAGIDLQLLAWFMGQADRVVTRARILGELWPSGTHVDERTVDVRVRRLRCALAGLGCGRYLQTVRGSGYRFSAFA